MKRVRYLWVIVSALFLMSAAIPGSALAVEIGDGKLTLNGSFHNWTGYRWGTYSDERGDGLSMFRNSLQLEAEARFNEQTSLYAIFRATKESSYKLEEEAVDFGNFEEDDLDEADFREYYLQSQITDRIWTAVGRQQVVWGDVAGFRVMDIVNPLDLRWHFSLENWEDIRIPLHMLNTIVSIPEVNANIQLVWVPGIDPLYNRVNRSYGNPGHRWGVNNPPGALAPGEVVDLGYTEDSEADPNGISKRLEDGDIGMRWQHTVGGLTYALMGFYGFNQNPSVWMENGEVQVEHQRQPVFGFSFNWYDNFTEAVLRGEAGFFPDMDYTTATYDRVELDTFKFAIGYDRNTTFNWLDPTRSIINNWQLIGTYIFDHQDDLIVAGYGTEIKEFDLIATVFLNWGWDKDHWTINISPAWNIDRKWGMVQSWIDYKPRWLNGLTLTPKVNYFWGDDPYTGDFAMVRGNSEALFEIKYEF